MYLLLREAVVGTAGHATVWANAVFGATAENGRNGVIIFPDNYTQLTSSVAPVNINTAKAAYDANTYSYDAWKATEAAGSVFLPAGGAYTGATPLNHEAGGYYWSSTDLRRPIMPTPCTSKPMTWFRRVTLIVTTGIPCVW